MQRRTESIVRAIPILVGSAIYAFGLHYFIIPNELMEGGLTGIALLLRYIFGFSPSLTILLLNIPLFVIGWRTFGLRTIAYTVVGTVGVSFFLWITSILIEQGWIVPFRTEQDFFLATLYAGVTLGIGLGIVFRFGGTTGGGDIIARLINKRKGWRMGQIILTFDACVIFASLLYIPREKVLYTLVAVFIASKLIDFIQGGALAAKAFTIVSEQSAALAQAITDRIDRGVTLFPAKGAYSNRDKVVIYCIVYRHEMRKLIALVRNIDPRAFMIIHDVQDVLGEGFRLHE